MAETDARAFLGSRAAVWSRFGSLYCLISGLSDEMWYKLQLATGVGVRQLVSCMYLLFVVLSGVVVV